MELHQCTYTGYVSGSRLCATFRTAHVKALKVQGSPPNSHAALLTGWLW